MNSKIYRSMLQGVRHFSFLILIIAMLFSPQALVQRVSADDTGQTGGEDQEGYPPPNPSEETSSIDPLSSQSPDASVTPFLLGTYLQGYVNTVTVNNQLVALDTWTGKHSTLAGIILDLEDPNVNLIPQQLDQLWNAGYTAYIDLATGYYSQPKISQVASGAYDQALAHWAQVYRSWAVNGKFAFIAPFPEMNVPYVSYGFDPDNYILAFRRIEQIFTQNNVPRSAVRWVFAPNGWSHHPFEPYYPGDSYVDVVGFSSFNFGYCPIASNQLPGWDDPAIVYGPFIREMRKLAPGKPIFITRLGTTAYVANQQTNTQTKNDWLVQTYDYLSHQPDVRAALYYNLDLSWDCDWMMFKKNGVQYVGYLNAVKSSALIGYLAPAALAGSTLNMTLPPGVYLPMLANQAYTRNTQNPILIGFYSPQWPGTHRVVRDNFHNLEAWAGKHISLAGTFIDLMADPKVFIELQLETLADNDYTPFVNLSTAGKSGPTARDIAIGNVDANLRADARAFKSFARGGTRMVFLAPLQEMNTSTVSYGGDPGNFKLAYRHIQTIFAQEGVPAQSIKWVFAPNGTSDIPGDPGFEAYYPGDSYVDALSFTGYHYGYCSWAPASWRGWQGPDMILGQFINRLIALSPHKPIIVGQTATSAFTSHGKDINAKNQWLNDAYTYLANFPQVKGVMYFNWDFECDWALFHNGGEKYEGFRQVVAGPRFDYLTPDELMNANLYVP